MINYTPIVLFGLGVLGIVLHILVELNKLNRSSNLTFSVSKYLKLEIYSILISLIMCFVSVIISQEIKQIAIVGKWLGLAFMAIGYMGQSLLIFMMGKANKIVNNENQNNEK
jgi:hypothetical protein